MHFAKMDHHHPKKATPKGNQSQHTHLGQLLSLQSIFLNSDMYAEKPRDSLRCRIRALFFVLLLFTFAFLSFTIFSPFKLEPCYHYHKRNAHLLSSTDTSSTLNLSHLFFAIGSCSETWENRQSYVEVWWRPGAMQGHVWLDEDPPGGKRFWSPNCPPYKVSGDASQFGPRVSAARIARIVKEAYLAALDAPGSQEVRWLVMGDDDTIFFPENLLEVLRRYDHREMWYVGGVSESVEQALYHSYSMAYGGGGYAISLPAVAEISRVLDRCLYKYFMYYGSDHRVQACMSELGVPLTRELGFHQMDIKGDAFGLLAAHPVTPMVSLHHIDYVDPIFPDARNRTEALQKLAMAGGIDPSRILQQSICYEPTLRRSVSVSWGYVVQVYPRIVTPDRLQAPLQTFQTWGTLSNGPFNFNTRPVSPDPCLEPVTFFLHRVLPTEGSTSVTEYRRVNRKNISAEEYEQKRCKREVFLMVERIESVRVIAPLMDPHDLIRAPRRHCCEAKTESSSGGSMTMNVRIRKCGPGETASPP